MKKSYLTLTILIFLAGFSCKRDYSIEAEIRNAMLECVEESIAPGMGLGYYSEKEGTILLAVGQSDIEKNKPLETTTQYPIQSVTKMFISILTLQLIEDNLLSLESTVDEWIDSVPKGSQITIRHLLTHRSGLKDYRAHPEYIDTREYSLAERINAGFEISTETEIGNIEYSNTNSVTLARIIEIVTQQSIGQVLKERIFIPAGMRHSHYKPEILNDKTNIVTCYKFGEAIDLNWIIKSSSAGGGIISTIEDMLNFGNWLLENDYHLLMAPESEIFDWITFEGETSGKHGLGIFLEDSLYSIPMMGHTGGNPGLLHFFFFSKDTGEIIVYYINEGRLGKPFGKFMKDLDETLQRYR